MPCHTQTNLWKCWPIIYDTVPSLTQHMATTENRAIHRKKHTLLYQCCFIVGPLSTMLAQHYKGMAYIWARDPTAAQQKGDVNPMLVQCWPIVCDAGPALYRHWVNVSCLLGVIRAGHPSDRPPSTMINLIARPIPALICDISNFHDFYLHEFTEWDRPFQTAAYVTLLV